MLVDPLYLVCFLFLWTLPYLALDACITTTLPADRWSSLFSILALVPLVYINVTPESQTSSLFSRDYHQNPLRVHALRLHDWCLRWPSSRCRYSSRPSDPFSRRRVSPRHPHWSPYPCHSLVSHGASRKAKNTQWKAKNTPEESLWASSDYCTGSAEQKNLTKQMGQTFCLVFGCSRVSLYTNPLATSFVSQD